MVYQWSRRPRATPAKPLGPSKKQLTALRDEFLRLGSESFHEGENWRKFSVEWCVLAGANSVYYQAHKNIGEAIEIGQHYGTGSRVKRIMEHLRSLRDNIENIGYLLESRYYDTVVPWYIEQGAMQPHEYKGYVLGEREARRDVLARYAELGLDPPVKESYA